MLTKLRCKNFKAWTDSGEIRLAPLTVLFGANSAGKTSIPQLLLLLKQTAASPDRQRALQLGDARTLVDLGTYADLVYGHDTALPLEIELEWTLEEPLTVTDPLGSDLDPRYEGDSLHFRLVLKADNRQQPRVDVLEYALRRGGAEVLDVSMRKQANGKKYQLDSTNYQLTRRQQRAWPLPEPVRFYGFPDEATAYFQNTAFLADLVLRLERMLLSLFYMGPLREYPKRLYIWSGEVPDHVGVRGDRAIEALLAAGSRKFNWKPKQRTRNLPELVAEQLATMELIQDFEVKQLGKHRKEYEVLVQTHPRLPQVKLTDVGFGVSQVLPVIVECFYVPHRSIIIFEQPEIHLHPRVQADLADLFIAAIHARENGEPRDCQLIIESHSEHFLRRLQLRIAEEALSPEDAALYFVDTEKESARLQELQLDEYGRIANWPDRFFGDAIGETEKQMRRMIKRLRESDA